MTGNFVIQRFGATLLASCLFSAVAGAELQDIFVAGTDGYSSYRIPSVLVTSKATLLAFCEGRKNGPGDSGDIDLLLKRSSDCGKTWSHPAYADGKLYVREGLTSGWKLSCFDLGPPRD
jgi:sialidase-1